LKSTITRHSSRPSHTSDVGLTLVTWHWHKSAVLIENTF